MRIVTDSAADFEPEELVRLGVESVSLGVSFGETFYRENETLTKAQFYTQLQEHREFPRPRSPPLRNSGGSSARPGNGEETLGVFLLSSGLSGTFRARNWQKRPGIPGLLSGGQSHRLCRAADSGGACGRSAGVREERSRNRRRVGTAERRVVLYACLDTLKYLQKGGRISTAAAVIGAVAGVKPILTVTREGKPEIVSKALGMRRAVAICGNS